MPAQTQGKITDPDKTTINTKLKRKLLIINIKQRLTFCYSLFLQVK